MDKKTEDLKNKYNVLIEAYKLMESKGNDYQNSRSNIVQADYYPGGIRTIADTINAKNLRIQSLLEIIQSGGFIKHESLRDSFIDTINYCVFAILWIDSKIEGQCANRDLFNRQIVPDDRSAPDITVNTREFGGPNYEKYKTNPSAWAAARVVASSKNDHIAKLDKEYQAQRHALKSKLDSLDTEYAQAHFEATFNHPFTHLAQDDD